MVSLYSHNLNFFYCESGWASLHLRAIHTYFPMSHPFISLAHFSVWLCLWLLLSFFISWKDEFLGDSSYTEHFPGGCSSFDFACGKFGAEYCEEVNEGKAFSVEKWKEGEDRTDSRRRGGRWWRDWKDCLWRLKPDLRYDPLRPADGRKRDSMADAEMSLQERTVISSKL